MKKLIIFESILILFFVMAWSVSKSENNVFGYGHLDCGEMINLYDENEPNKTVFESYIWGFITALHLRNDTVSNASGTAIAMETINYCRNNPLETFYGAIIETYSKIIE